LKIIQDNIEAIKQLCLKHHVKEMFAFGSVTNSKKFNDQSDVDLIIKFEEIPVEEYADHYFDLADELEKVFGRRVDLLIDKPIKNPYFKEAVEESKTRIYAA